MRDDGTGNNCTAYQSEDPRWVRWAVGESGIQATWVGRQGSWLRLIAGWTCIGVGLLGLILPIIPGIPLLIFGLLLLSTQYRWAHKAALWMKARFHKDETKR